MRPESIHDRQVSLEEATRILGYSRSAIYRFIDAGNLRAVKVGKFVRFYESELARWRTANTHPFKVNA